MIASTAPCGLSGSQGEQRKDRGRADIGNIGPTEDAAGARPQALQRSRPICDYADREGTACGRSHRAPPIYSSLTVRRAESWNQSSRAA
jgi:hypothetical protein